MATAGISQGLFCFYYPRNKNFGSEMVVILENTMILLRKAKFIPFF